MSGANDPASPNSVSGANDPAPSNSVSGANVKRGPGRPRAGSPTDTKDRIVAAARKRFATDGFDGAGLRAIAADAGVDASLIRHYFGDKSGLLIATMQLPVNPVELLTPLLAAGPDGLAERILSTFLSAWDPHRDVFSGLIRTTVGSADRSAPMMQILRGFILTSLRDVLTGPDRELRATLFASQLLGMAVLRYVLELDPLADAPVEQVVSLYAPSLQLLLTPTR